MHRAAGKKARSIVPVDDRASRRTGGPGPDVLAEAAGDAPLGVEELARALAEAKARIRELEELAHVDELTGVLNRRGFLRELRRAASYSERYGAPVAVVVVDVDAFKCINDSHGHAAGDEVLRQVARRLMERVRASDAVGRIGGDEFALLLWHASEEAAAEKMRDVDTYVAAAPLIFRGVPLSVRISWGVAGLRRGSSAESALEAADAALYAARTRRAARVTR